MLETIPLKDKFVRRCRSISERITEEVSEIEGEWLTELDMQNLGFSEYLVGKYAKNSSKQKQKH